MQGPRHALLQFWNNRDLILQFTERELHVRHKGSRLGHLWALLSPLSMLCLYLFVFGFIMGGKFGVLPDETTYDYALALFLGLSLYHIIAETLGMASLLIVNQPNFVKKVVFPLEIIPVSHVAASVYHALLSILLLVVASFFSRHGVALTGVLALPVLILPLVMIALGLSWSLAALGVYVRDIAQLVPFVSTGFMFSSAVFYAPSKVPQEIWCVLRFNPLVHIISQGRRVLLWGQPLEWGTLAWVYAGALAIFLVGFCLFRALRPFFAEVI